MNQKYFKIFFHFMSFVMCMLIFFHKTKLFEIEYSNIFAVSVCIGRGTVWYSKIRTTVETAYRKENKNNKKAAYCTIPHASAFKIDMH